MRTQIHGEGGGEQRCDVCEWWIAWVGRVWRLWHRHAGIEDTGGDRKTDEGFLVEVGKGHGLGEDARKQAKVIALSSDWPLLKEVVRISPRTLIHRPGKRREGYIHVS